MKFGKVLASIMLLFTIGVVGSGCTNDRNEITIAEVTHSVFYAPQYAAIELGFFADEDLKVSLVNTNGADKTMAALLSKDAQIGLMGTEASIYVYNEGQTNYSICFAQLTKRDGSFVVGRDKVSEFTFDIFKGKEILGGRKGGVPAMALEYVLKENGLTVGRNDGTKDVNVRTDIAFAAQAGAFISGEADFTTLFEPTATSLEKDGKGHVVMSLGAYTDSIPYTVYSCTKSYMENNGDIIEKFTRAIYKGQQWIASHTAKEIAEVIAPHFPDSAIEDLTIVMQRYIDIDAWCLNPIFEEEGFELLMDIMENANELDKRAPYDILVNNEFSRKVINK